VITNFINCLIQVSFAQQNYEIMSRKIIILFLVTVVLFSCKRVERKNDEKVSKDTIAVELENNHNYSNQLLYSTLWFQRAAERRALSYQTFNLAKLNIDKMLLNIDSSKQAAIVVDIDETMLDNSNYEAKLIKTNASYTSSSWKEWVNRAEAIAIPGAIEFCNYAHSKNVNVFYISNRKVDVLDVTIKNMRKLGFPDAIGSHILLKEETSCKKNRREKVEENFQILLLIGDNLGDFSEIFADRSINYGFDTVDGYKNEFGNRFIILPNPMYGDWMKAVYNGTNKISDEEKERLRREALIAY